MEEPESKVMVVVCLITDGDDPEEAGRLAKAAHAAADEAAAGDVEMNDFKIQKLHPMGPAFPDFEPPDGSQN